MVYVRASLVWDSNGRTKNVPVTLRVEVEYFEV